MSDTRDRMIEAAAESVRRCDVAGTSFSDVLRESGAARGVIYHHFPGGKDELAQAAVRWTGQKVGERFEALQPADATPAGVVRAFLASVRPAVADSAAGAGCAVAAAAAEGRPESALQAAAHIALGSWRDALAGHLANAGMGAKEAAELASLLIAMLEGAHVLCRAQASSEPFDAAAEAMLALLVPQVHRV